MEILKEIKFRIRFWNIYYQKSLEKTEKWVEHNTWQFLERFGHLLYMIKVNSFSSEKK